MPSAMGLLGAIPALQLSHVAFSSAYLLLWGLLLGLFGVGIGYALRKRYIEDDKLPFPSGIAVAQVITSLHAVKDQKGDPRARALSWTGLVSAACVWFRDGKPAFIPSDIALPFTLRGIAASDLTLALSVSPMMLGLGFIVGPRTGLSLALGALIGWAILSPDLLAHGVVAHATYPELVNWLMWPGVALMLAPAFVMLFAQVRYLVRSARDLGALGTTRSPLLILCFVAPLPLVAIGWYAFSLPPLATCAALLLTLVFASVCARSAGETDISPVGSIGQLTQVVFGTVSAHAAVNITAGSITSGAAAQTATGLWTYRAGQVLRASPERMFAAQVIGVVFGALVSIPAYYLIVRGYGLATTAMPAQSAITWKALSELLTKGGAAVPSFAGVAAAIAFALGLVVTALEKTRLAWLCPAPMAVGVAMITPADYSFSICIGSLLFYGLWKMSRTKTEMLAASLGAGAIAGESFTGVLIALVNWLRS